MITETIKQALIRLGFVPIKRYVGGGKYVGITIYKDGEPVHSTPVASDDFAIELIEKNGGFTKEESAQ